jgi:hypothetical protein
MKEEKNSEVGCKMQEVVSESQTVGNIHSLRTAQGVSNICLAGLYNAPLCFTSLFRTQMPILFIPCLYHHYKQGEFGTGL